MSSKEFLLENIFDDGGEILLIPPRVYEFVLIAVLFHPLFPILLFFFLKKIQFQFVADVCYFFLM